MKLRSRNYIKVLITVKSLTTDKTTWTAFIKSVILYAVIKYKDGDRILYLKHWKQKALEKISKLFKRIVNIHL